MGSLGIVSALAYASEVLNNKLINEAAYEIAMEISCFKMENQKLVSANICHGTLGVAHVFTKNGIIIIGNRLKLEMLLYIGINKVVI